MPTTYSKKQRVRLKTEGETPEATGTVVIGTTQGHGPYVVVRLDDEYHLSSEDEGLRILESDQIELLSPL